MRIYSFITSERTQKTAGANRNLKIRVLVGDKIENRQIVDIEISHEPLGGSRHDNGAQAIDQYTARVNGEIIKQFRRDKKTRAWLA